MDLGDYARDPVRFIDDLVQVNERGQAFRLFPHQREILGCAFAFDADGRLPWETLVYSCPKKSGKTTINAALTAWWAFCQEAPNELYIIANDLEQAQARVFASLSKLIQRNPGLLGSAEALEARRIVLSNGSAARPLASDVPGSAGSDHGLTSWDELWGYTSEGSRRLWEEMTGVPTRRNSVRLVTTYAGIEGESKLLWDLYVAGVGPEEHPAGRGVRIHPTLPLWLNPEARLLVYWDHEPRMPWQTPSYYQAQRTALRPATYLRLHENRWAVAESTFITPALWDGCTEPTWSPLEPDPDVELFVGVDAATKHDTAAVVGVVRDDEDRLIVLGVHQIWHPSPGAPLDLELTIEQYVRELDAQFRVVTVRYDPFQLHRSAMTLRAAGLPMEEYAQTAAHVTAMGERLFGLLRARALVLYPDAELRDQALNTTAIESAAGWRIAKATASRKVDAITALAMACGAALDARICPPLRLLNA